MKRITIELALASVQVIKDLSHDSEVAHCEEDDLRHWFIDCISLFEYDPKELKEIATIVKSTSEIKFSRWYA